MEIHNFQLCGNKDYAMALQL